MIGGFTTPTFAESLDVQFVPDPLFNNPNFLPQDVESGVVTVSNNSGTTQEILTEAINIFDADNFGNLLHLKIAEDSNVLFDDTLSHFFANAGEYSLGTISNGSSRVFTYTVLFNNSNDNSYQGKSLGFDICVGFKGGNTHCGNTVINDDDDDDDGGGGGGGGSLKLIIWDEKANDINGVGESGSATITWKTNKLATSQVIYGLKSGGPYDLDLNAPNFGYPFSNIEDPTKVMSHSMIINGLIPGETYSFRVVSRASPATVSPEHEFSIPVLAFADNNLGPIDGNVLGVNTENVIEDDGVVAGDSTNNLAAAVASSIDLAMSSCSLFSLIILIIIYLIWKFWLRKRYEKMGFKDEEIKTKFYLFFGFASLLVVILLLIFGKYCPLAIFTIISILSAGFYTYRKLKIK